jgi:transitional endoplasmic reticulum ATPase
MIFKKARQASPAIVFIDEIDSIAPRRGMQTSSGVTERIVNQLLTSIDGLEALERVLVLAATNRPDILDEALLRTGRFDRLLYVGPPNFEGRLEILKVHTHKMPLEDVRLEEVARRTEGYVGSDLAALTREAGLVAIRENVRASKVTMAHFEEAMKLTHPSTDPESLKFYEEFSKSILRERLGRKKEEAAQVIYR